MQYFIISTSSFCDVKNYFFKFKIYECLLSCHKCNFCLFFPVGSMLILLEPYPDTDPGFLVLIFVRITPTLYPGML